MREMMTSYAILEKIIAVNGGPLERDITAGTEVKRHEYKTNHNVFN